MDADTNQELGASPNGPAEPSPQELRRQRQMLAGIIAALIFILALIILGVWYLLTPGTPTDRIRDVFIIFLAMESMVLGLVLVILIVQLARLINLLQNEIKPILDSTNQTVSTLRGTTAFLSNNLVEPVIKLNEYLAGLQQAMRVIGLARGKPKNQNSQGE
jgi:flagellar biogenesis protein FliO